MRDEFGSRFVAESCPDGIQDTVERSFADAAAGFRNRQNDSEILTSSFLFCLKGADSHFVGSKRQGGLCQKWFA